MPWTWLQVLLCRITAKALELLCNVWLVQVTPILTSTNQTPGHAPSSFSLSSFSAKRVTLGRVVFTEFFFCQGRPLLALSFLHRQSNPPIQYVGLRTTHS